MYINLVKLLGWISKLFLFDWLFILAQFLLQSFLIGLAMLLWKVTVNIIRKMSDISIWNFWAILSQGVFLLLGSLGICLGRKVVLYSLILQLSEDKQRDHWGRLYKPLLLLTCLESLLLGWPYIGCDLMALYTHGDTFTCFGLNSWHQF